MNKINATLLRDVNDDGTIYKAGTIAEITDISSWESGKELKLVVKIEHELLVVKYSDMVITK